MQACSANVPPAKFLRRVRQFSDVPLMALFGAWKSCFWHAKYAPADALARQLARRALRQRDRVLAAGVSVMAGLCSLYRGRLRQARQQLELGLRVIDSEQRAFESISETLAPATVGYNLCWALWSQGYPDAALALVERGLASSRINARPYFTAYLMHLAGVVHELRGEHAEALQHAASMQEFCKEHELGLFIPLARYQQAVQRSYLAEPAAADEVEQWIASFRTTASEVAASRRQAVLAEAQLAAGHFDRALVALKIGFELVLANDEHFWESELHRLQGELWLQLAREGKSAVGCDLGASGAHSPEACLFEALRVARAQGALSLELRAALSIARMLQYGPRHGEARSLLAHVYEQFFEGFETRDLIAARTMLDELDGLAKS